MAFMLLSYVVLPAQQTRSHYLSVCLIIAILMIALGFTIPLGAQPDQCYDAITPNDMYSLTECAWSGAFIIAGGLSADMWIFIRALSMNLQICWDIVPGKKFFYFSQLFGWGIPAILFTITLTITGLSFRFGSACHVNHANSMGDFWGPLLAFAGASGILQLTTFGYCIHVYLRNLWSDGSATSTATSGRSLPSYQGSVRTQTARAVYRRLKKVLWLQWRGICICSIILVDVIFFSIVFVYLDGMQTAIKADFRKVEPWILCLAANPADKNACLDRVDGWLVNEPTVIAVLILLSLAGVQVFLLLTRPSIFPAWWGFIRSKLSTRQEFVSLDARSEVMRNPKHEFLHSYQRGHQQTTFEMQPKPPPHVITVDLDQKGFSNVSSPEDAYKSPLHDASSPAYESTQTLSPPQPQKGTLPPEYAGRITPSPAATDFRPHMNDYFASPAALRDSSDSARRYQAPKSSFSVPTAPSRENSTRSVSFDTRDVYTRGAGGLGLNPPSEAGESEVYEEDVRVPGRTHPRRL